MTSLEQIVSIKRETRDRLKRKHDSVVEHGQPYTHDFNRFLSFDEQLWYSRLGMFLIGEDLKYYATNYKPK